MISPSPILPILERYVPAIDRAMREACLELDPGIGRMVSYHHGWTDRNGAPVNATSGKRLRPVLVLLVADMLGAALEKAIDAAVAVELLHNFSLIHDDLQDRSPDRHHRPTVWRIWGDAQAINAGDALHVLAQRVLALSGRSGVPAESVLACLDTFSRASLKLCEGQYLDISYEGLESIGENDYLTMIGGKTAALVACCFELGAIVASDDAALRGKLAVIGRDLGLAFQIWDDYLGAWGDEAVTGKPVADDIRSSKKTHAYAAAFEQAGDSDRHTLVELYKQSPLDDAQVSSVLTLYDKLGIPDYMRKLAERYVDSAIDAIETIPSDTTRRHELISIARFLVGRDH